MTVRQTNMIKNFTIGAFCSFLTIIAMLITLGFKGGIEKERINTHEKEIKIIKEHKLNKEVFDSFKCDYEKDKDDLQKILFRIEDKIDKLH